jgi:type II secretory pathway pseudopilin PulG
MRVRSGINSRPAGSRQAGFTLVELLIVMAFFMVVIAISSAAFEHILSGATQQVKTSESNVQGIVGLEIMRSDLVSMGYGLPWRMGFAAEFDESTVADNALANGINPTDFNDSQNASDDAMKVPRAIQGGTATGASDWENGRDYLVIKSVSVGMNATSKKWNYVESYGATSYIKESGGGSDDFLEKDRVVTLDTKTRALIGTATNNFFYAVPAKVGGKFVPPADFRPVQDTDVYLVYGVDTWSDTATLLRAPYNRVDYYIKRPAAAKDIPARCAPGTGILYKANMDHSDGGVTDSEFPLLDCVADMQVIYALDSNGDGGVDLHGNEDILANLSAKSIREQLKEVRVYILAHEGLRDDSYVYSGGPAIPVGEFGLGRSYDLSKLESIGNSWKNYRWKIFNLIVNPKNLSQ